MERSKDWMDEAEGDLMLKKSSGSVQIFYPKFNKEELIQTLALPRLEPHVYSDSEYQKIKKTINKMTKNGIVLFQV